MNNFENKCIIRIYLILINSNFLFSFFLHLGVRIFVPNPVSKTIEHIGGPNVMLGLVAMSNDIESFYASVKAFVCILKSNKHIQNELLRTKAYQVRIYLHFFFLFDL